MTFLKLNAPVYTCECSSVHKQQTCTHWAWTGNECVQCLQQVTRHWCVLMLLWKNLRFTFFKGVTFLFHLSLFCVCRMPQSLSIISVNLWTKMNEHYFYFIRNASLDDGEGHRFDSQHFQLRWDIYTAHSQSACPACSISMLLVARN